MTNPTRCQAAITEPGPVSNIRRRAFLSTALLGIAATVSVGFPLATYMIAPALKKGKGKWVDFGPIEDLEVGRVSMLTYEFMVRDGWLVLPQRGFIWAAAEGADKFTVFSSTCTHLACNVIWREEARVFECPCHSGRFDTSGEPIAGPPTRRLAKLKHEVEDGNLTVLIAT